MNEVKELEILNGEDTFIVKLQCLLKKSKITNSDIHELRDAGAESSTIDSCLQKTVCDNLRKIHKSIKNQNGREIFLLLKNPLNGNDLLEKIDAKNKATVYHWANNWKNIGAVSSKVVPFSGAVSQRLYEQSKEEEKKPLAQLMHSLCGWYHKKTEEEIAKKILKKRENLS